MDAEIRHGPAFAAIFVTLRPGDRITVESGGMASMSAATAMRTRFNGGFFRAIMRKLFGGESLFVNEFTCADGQDRAELVITQPTPGDMRRVDLRGETLILTSGSFIACGEGVRFGVNWAGFASWWSGEGLFRLTVSGNGPVFFGGYGGVIDKDIAGSYVVDSGHLLAYEPTVRLKVGLAGGIFSSFFGGEGFVTRTEGQGRIYMQSRSLDNLAAWTNRHLF